MLKSYPVSVLYLLIISLSIMVIGSSNNWFFTWMGFELSLFGFLPLFAAGATTTESIMKYYLMQAGGSALFLMSFLMITNSTSLTVLGMLMKLGIFPFFQWMPVIMSSLSWTGNMILVTIQKVGPLFVLIQMKNTTFPLLVGVMGIFVSSILGFNQSNLRPLMAYSSISHTSWLVLTTPLNLKITVLYMMFYFSLTCILFLSFSKTGAEKVTSTPLKKHQVFLQSACFILLAGIPPFSVFFFKICILYMLMKLPLFVGILLFSTYISTYYYLSFALPNMLNSFSKSPAPWSLMFLNLIPIFFMM